jgi:hypothetical protein
MEQPGVAIARTCRKKYGSEQFRVIRDHCLTCLRSGKDCRGGAQHLARFHVRDMPFENAREVKPQLLAEYFLLASTVLFLFMKGYMLRTQRILLQVTLIGCRLCDATARQAAQLAD